MAPACVARRVTVWLTESSMLRAIGNATFLTYLLPWRRVVGVRVEGEDTLLALKLHTPRRLLLYCGSSE